jgi:hypothetical protein
MGLDPQAEFDAPETPVAPEPAVAPAPTPAPAPAVSPADIAALRGELNSKLKEIDELKSDAAVVRKLRDVFAPESGGDPKDEWAKREIKRLVPELDDIDKIKSVLPLVMEALGASAEEKLQEKAGTAVEHMKGMMKDAGLDPADEDSVSYMEEVLTRVIKGDPALQALWARGNIKAVVSKAWDKAQSKIIAPIRTKAKQSAVRTITESPRATPRGNAPSPAPAGTRTVDTRDTTRAGVSKVHDAAFDRLQELLDN